MAMKMITELCGDDEPKWTSIRNGADRRLAGIYRIGLGMV
jgi:hypothetical protein